LVVEPAETVETTTITTNTDTAMGYGLFFIRISSLFPIYFFDYQHDIHTLHNYFFVALKNI
jgi:hypothetical protein